MMILKKNEFIFWIIFKAYVCSTEQILQCKYFEENKSNLAYKGPVHTIQKEFVKKKSFLYTVKPTVSTNPPRLQ